MLTGRVVRFDEVRGYGFIAPDGAGHDVFVHANTVEGDKSALAPGVPVEYEAVDSDRGPKAVLVRVADGAAEHPSAAPEPREPADASGDAQRGPAGGEDEALCDVLSERAFTAESTEALLTSIPDLTAAQVVEIRHQMLVLARRHGWVEG